MSQEVSIRRTGRLPIDRFDSGRLFLVALAALVISGGLSGGCAAPRVTADPVYYPSPPAPPRVVHLKSFNRLGDLVPTRGSWLDVFRGRSPSPYVGTPAGIAYRDGHLYICDTDLNAVHDWDLATGDAKRIGTRGDVVLAKPVAVAVSNDGNVYVADTGRAEVVAYDAAGRYTRRFKPADRDAYRPVALAVHDAKLFVADIASHRIDVFATANGEHLEAFGQIGSAPGRFYFPMGLAAGREGKLFVSDMLNARVQVLDAEHQPLLSMGRPGNRYGDMGKPRHLDLGPDGTLFIADSAFAHVHLFNEQGQLLLLIGGPNDGPGSTPMPVGIAVARNLPEPLAAVVPAPFAADYFVFVTNTIGPQRINLFAVGKARPDATE